MRKQSLCVTLPVCIAILIAGAWLANGGDLNPPAGPVSSTMRTLDEIYDAVVSGGGSANCPPCVWDVAYLDPGAGETEVVSGSGVIHGVMLSLLGNTSGLNLRLTNGPGDVDPDYILHVNLTKGSGTFQHGNAYVPLDVRFENGLYVHLDEDVSVHTNVYYHSDPE